MSDQSFGAGCRRAEGQPSGHDVGRRRVIWAVSAALVGLAGVAGRADAIGLTWKAGTNGEWVDAGGSWTTADVWDNTRSDTFTHSSATRSKITLSGDLDAGYLQNINGGVLYMAGGTLDLAGAGDNYIGRAGGAGAFYQSGGTVTTTGVNSGHLQIGSGGNSYGFYQMTGGTLNLDNRTLRIARTPFGANNDTGVFYQTSGTITTTVGFEMALQGAGNHAVYYMTGGTHMSTNRVGVMMTASNSTSQLTITNATLGTTNVEGNFGTLDMGFGNVAGQVSIVNLNAGGVLQVTRIRAEGTVPAADSIRHVNFNGGTIRDIRSTSGDGGAPLLSGPMSGQYYSTYVFGGGATIDIVNAPYTANVLGPLLAPTGKGVRDITYTLDVADRGSGYIGAPVVLIEGATGATAVANMEDDETGNGTFRVASITITNPGIGVIDTPTYTFVGGGATTAAKAGTLESAPNVSGGVTKTGLGAVNFSAVNTYTGETRIQQGTLTLTNPGDLSQSSMIRVSSGATFNPSSKIAAVFRGLGGAGSVNARNDAVVGQRMLVTERLSPGDNGVGTLTIIQGDLRVGDGVVYDYEIAGTTESWTSDQIALTQTLSQGDLSFEGAWTLKLTNLGSVDPEGLEFVLFSYTGPDPADIGTWTIDYGTTGWDGGVISLNASTNQVVLSGLTAVPEPACMSLLAVTAGALLRRRRLNA